MKLLKIALKNLTRNRRRTMLTALSTAFSIFVFSDLMSFSGRADCVVTETASSLRVAVHNRAGLTYLLPAAYKQKIGSMPHVEAVAAQSWFGGIYRDVSDQFPNLAIDHENIDKIWPDWGVTPIEFSEFKRVRMACLVGRATMKRQNWRVGQRIALHGTDYPIDLALTIVGTLGPKGIPDLVVFRRDYLEAAAGHAGQVSLMWVKVDAPHYVTQVMRAIDETFANSNSKTQSEAEAPFVGTFLSSCRIFVCFARLLCIVVLIAMALVCANTAAMSVRERRSEVAVMRALGFTRGVIVISLILECLAMNLSGGLAGCMAASATCRILAIMPAFQFLGAFEISPYLILQSIALSAITGVVGALPSALAAVSGPIADGLTEPC